MTTKGTTSDNERQQIITNSTTNVNEWQQVVQRVTMNEKEISRKCSDLCQPDEVEKKKKFFILEKSSGKGHFSLKCLIEKFKVFFSTVSGWPRIATFSITLIAKSWNLI